jgi:hypothetical protein
MSQFKLTRDKLPDIAGKLGADQADIDSLFPVFLKFYDEVREQHLSSVMRALELRIRRKHGKPSFTIDWVSMPIDAPPPLKASVGLSWPDRFAIVVHPELNLEQTRTHVAHELGHLFYATEYPEKIGDKELHQKMANVFGVFTMLERSEFYQEKAPKMIPASWMQVVNDFT